LYLVDDNGLVIDEYGPNYADLDLPNHRRSVLGSGDASPDQARAMLARRLARCVARAKHGGAVSQIDVSDSRNAVVLLDGDPTLVGWATTISWSAYSRTLTWRLRCESAWQASTTWTCVSTSACR
jgi:hypothetical protein